MANKSVTPKKSIPIVVAIVDREKIIFCGEEIAQNIEFLYPANAVRDLEVVSRNSLLSALKELLVSHKIAASRLVMLLSPNIYYEKQLSKVSESERVEEVQVFLDIIPFVTVSSRQFRVGDNIYLVAINRTFYEAIHAAFVEAGLEVIAVTPMSVIPGLDAKAGLSPDQCVLISKHPESAVQNSFLTEENTDPDFSARKEKFLKKHQMILGGFSVLAVMVALATSVYTLQRPTHKPAAAAKPMVTLSPTQPAATATPTPVRLRNPDEIKIKIINASGKTGLAQKVKSQLEKLGFSQVQVGTATTSAGPTEVAFSETVDPALTQTLQKWLVTNYPEYRQSTMNSSGSAEQVILVLGN